MKRQIRRGVYETNSSSTHVICMCSKEDYDMWDSGDLLYWDSKEKLMFKEDIIKELKEKRHWDGTLYYPDVDWDDEDEIKEIFEDEKIQTSEEFFDDEYLETFEEEYTTSSGEKIISFGKYGYCG